MILGAAFGSDVLRALLQGTPPGTIYALLALGLVLTYKTSGVFNLALGAQAYVSGAMYFQCRVNWGWPIIPSLVVSVFLLAPGIGIVLERFVFRRLHHASTVAKLVITIGLAVALPRLFDLIIGFEPVQGQTPVGIVPHGADVYYSVFGVYKLSRDELTMIGVAVIVMGGLALLFRYSAIGLRMRAVVESPRMTELNGVRADRVSSFSWALSSFFVGLAGVLIAPSYNSIDPNQFFYLMVIAIAAAAVGKLTDLPRALIGGIALGWALALLETFLPRWSDTRPWLLTIQQNLTPALPFVVLFGVLVCWPAIRRSRAVADPLSGVDPPPPAPAALTRSRILTRLTRGFWVCFFVAVALVVFFRANLFWMNQVTGWVVMTLIFLSITVITGFAGEISLCQGTFAAIGAFAVLQLSSHFGMSVFPAMIVGGVIAAAVGAILAFPVLRLGGIWLSIATLAFAYFFDSVMVKFSWVGGTLTRVPRPTIGPISMAPDVDDGYLGLSGNQWFLILAVIMLAIFGGLVLLIRSGTVGQTLRALRGSGLGAESIGISPARARITAFMISAFIAGIGGGLLAMQQGDVNYQTNFSPFVGLFWLVLVVSLGARTIEGALQAGFGFSLFNAVLLSGVFIGWIGRSPSLVPSFFPLSSTWTFVLFGLGALQFARHPEGLVENGKRQAFTWIERHVAFLRDKPDDVPLATREGAAP